jgi:hypothetical protein
MSMNSILRWKHSSIFVPSRNVKDENDGKIGARVVECYKTSAIEINKYPSGVRN